MRRLRFALRYALRHALVSLLMAVAAAICVFGLLYPPPYQALLGVGSIFMLLLLVDTVCGPLLTLLLASPTKSKHERWLDFALVGTIQLAALFYGLHSVWAARPVVLAFEVDRLVIATANEVQTDVLAQAPTSLQRLPWWGVLQVGTRSPQDVDEFFHSIGLGLSGISPAMRPDWWQSWETAKFAMSQRAHPITELLVHRPKNDAALQAAIAATDLPIQQLRYLPLTSRHTKDWIALLDVDMRIVGYAPVDGFAAFP